MPVPSPARQVRSSSCKRSAAPTRSAVYLPRLLSSDYDQRLHAAQFVTEIQGGSDVGANSCRARADHRRKGWYRISGEKWFCSVADAGLFVVSARVDGSPSGTTGLGLFLVPRHIDGRVNGFHLRNLKDKLGTRSMATGEIEFDLALGEAIGDLNHGFRNLVAIVLDTSRVHNAIAACGIARRALAEGHAFAQHRRAFTNVIARYPGVQEILARMKLSTMAALATTFRILAMSDLIETGQANKDLSAARRISVLINKYWTARTSTACARDGIELLGGNGTIEDFSVLPRLYRDAIVVESWEGTHNTLVAQVLRDFSERGLHRPWLDRMRTEIDLIDHPQIATTAGIARSLLDAVEGRISTASCGREACGGRPDPPCRGSSVPAHRLGGVGYPAAVGEDLGGGGGHCHRTRDLPADEIGKGRPAGRTRADRFESSLQRDDLKLLVGPLERGHPSKRVKGLRGGLSVQERSVGGWASPFTLNSSPFTGAERAYSVPEVAAGVPMDVSGSLVKATSARPSARTRAAATIGTRSWDQSVFVSFPPP